MSTIIDLLGTVQGFFVLTRNHLYRLAYCTRETISNTCHGQCTIIDLFGLMQGFFVLHHCPCYQLTSCPSNAWSRNRIKESLDLDVQTDFSEKVSESDFHVCDHFCSAALRQPLTFLLGSMRTPVWMRALLFWNQLVRATRL